MASSVAESLPDLNQLFRDISLKFYPAESEDVVQYLKRIYGEQFKSLGNQDLLSCLDRLYEFGYVSSSNLTLLGEFVASKSINQNVINKRIENFKASRPSDIKKDIELQGRSTEIQEIMKSLNSKQNAVVNLYGATGIGKTALAKKIYAKWMGKKHVVDLRESKDMEEVYVNIMSTLKLSVPERVLPMVYVVGRIHKYIENESDGQPVLFLLDNVEQLTEGKGNEGKNLRIQLIQFLNDLSGYEYEKGSLNMLLTSRFAIKVKETVTDYELQPLENFFSEKILLPWKTSSVNTWQREKLLGICKGVPLLLKGTAAILRQRRKSPNDLIRVTETSSQKETQTPSNSNLTGNKEEKPLDFKEEGVDESQMSVIREMFSTLPSDSLRMSAVSLSLFHAPFPATTAAKVLGMRIPEAVAQLEGLTTSEIIQHVLDGEDKQMMYDIHPLLKKYAESIANEAKFCESYTKAERRFYEHFLSEMKRIAGFIESDYVKAFFEFERDRQNYEFTIDSTLLPEYFSVPGGYQEKALIVSLFNAMLTGEKQTKLFHSWAEVCRDDGNLGSLFRAQLRCWEARLVSETQGPLDGFEVLRKASLSLEQVQDQSSKYFEQTKRLSLYVEGEIYYQNRDYKKAIKCLESSLDLVEHPSKPDTNLARCYNALGNCYYRVNNVEKALEYYTKALKVREQLSGSEYHYDMPVYKNQIGTVYEAKGEYEEAVKWYKEALRLLEDLKISGYEDEALFCRNLANVLMRQEKYHKAVEPAEKAYNIRQKRLGTHPDTVRSIFQLGVLQANLRAYHKALNHFLTAWKMEKSLVAGNHNEVWRLIIKGVFDMYDFLKIKEVDKEKFRQEALEFCQHFWKGEIMSPHFSFTAFNKGIIDCILDLLSDTEEERDLRDEYKNLALWFDEGMQKEEDDVINPLTKQSSRETKQPGVTLRTRENTPFVQEKSSFTGKEEEEIEVEAEDDVVEASVLATPHVDSQEKTGEGSEVLAKTADEESQITIQGRTEGEFEHETESEGDLESEGMMEEEPEDDVKNIRSVIFRGEVTSEGTNWAVKEGGVHLMFPPDAVSELTPVMVQRWKYSHRSPPLHEYEAITSNVIELCPMVGQSLKFNTKVKLSLSHSATSLWGYELVIKRLIDKETNKWEEMDGTTDVRYHQENEDDYPFHVEIPDFFFPIAQADITECSTYAVVCRLKASPTYIITSKGGSLSHPDFPGVIVTIPENAVAPTEKFPVELKVQEVSNEEFEGESIIIGPVLRITRAVQFLRPVTIQLPISLRGQEVLNTDPTVYSVRVLFLKTEDEMKKWIEITGDLPEPPSFDGKFVRFQVDRFCRYSYFLDGRQENSSAERLGITSFLSRFIWNQPKPAIFVAYFCRDFPDILYLICCPPHLKRKVMDELEDKGITPYDGASKKNMIPGEDKAFVSVSEGIRPYRKKDIGQVFLKLEDFAFKTELRVRPNKDKDITVVKFWTTLKPTGTKFPLCKVHLNLSTQGINRTDLLGALGLPSTGTVKEGIPEDEELEYLSKKVHTWKTLGRRLMFDEAELQEFDHKDHEKVSEKAYTMLLAWKQRKGLDATYSVLNQALRNKLVNRADLAQEFCCQVV